MQKSDLNVKGDYLFPQHFIILGITLIVVSPVLLLAHFIVSILALLAGFFLSLSRQGVVFDKAKKQYKTYYSFFGMKTGEWKSLKEPVKVFINSSNSSTKFNAMVLTGYEIKNLEYSAYLKLGNGKKIYLGTSKDKSKLNKQIQPLINFYQISFSDNTEKR